MSSSPSQLSPANQVNITKLLFTPLGQDLSYWLWAFENTILPSSSWEHDSLAIWIKISYPLLSPTPSPPPPYSPHTPLSPLSWYLKLYTLVLGGACICVSLTWVGGHAYVLTLTQETDLRIQRYGDCQVRTITIIIIIMQVCGYPAGLPVSSVIGQSGVWGSQSGEEEDSLLYYC